jgi:hypothetical protein
MYPGMGMPSMQNMQNMQHRYPGGEREGKGKGKGPDSGEQGGKGR